MTGLILAAVLFSILSGGATFALQVTGLKDPAAFIVDPATGNYFISSENGQPTERDNNGFITKLGPDGKIINLKFIEGGAGGVTLHAPHGLARHGRSLYVSHIHQAPRLHPDTAPALREPDPALVPG